MVLHITHKYKKYNKIIILARSTENNEIALIPIHTPAAHRHQFQIPTGHLENLHNISVDLHVRAARATHVG